MMKNKTSDIQKINFVKTKKWIIKNNRFNSLSQSINRNKQNLLNKVKANSDNDKLHYSNSEHKSININNISFNNTNDNSFFNINNETCVTNRGTPKFGKNIEFKLKNKENDKINKIKKINIKNSVIRKVNKESNFKNKIKNFNKNYFSFYKLEKEYEIRNLKKKIITFKIKNNTLKTKLENIKVKNSEILDNTISSQNIRSYIISTLFNICINEILPMNLCNKESNNNLINNINRNEKLTYKELLFNLMDIKLEYENKLLINKFIQGLKKMFELSNIFDTESRNINNIHYYFFFINNLINKSKEKEINFNFKKNLHKKEDIYYNFCSQLMDTLNVYDLKELNKKIVKMKNRSKNVNNNINNNSKNKINLFEKIKGNKNIYTKIKNYFISHNKYKQNIVNKSINFNNKSINNNRLYNKLYSKKNKLLNQQNNKTTTTTMSMNNNSRETAILNPITNSEINNIMYGYNINKNSNKKIVQKQNKIHSNLFKKKLFQKKKNMKIDNSNTMSFNDNSHLNSYLSIGNHILTEGINEINIKYNKGTLNKNNDYCLTERLSTFSFNNNKTIMNNENYSMNFNYNNNKINNNFSLKNENIKGKNIFLKMPSCYSKHRIFSFDDKA